MTSKNVLVDLYIQKVDYWLPQPKELKKRLLETLRAEVLESIQDTGNPDPVKAYGDPYKIAKGLSLSKDWGSTRAGWGIRSLAFLLDVILIVSVCFAYLIFGLVIFFKIDIYQALTISEVSEALDILQSDLEIASFLIIVILFLFYVLGAAIIYSAYFVMLEKAYSATIGKKLLGLQVVDISGVRLTWKQTIVRNFTKLPGIIEFLPFDIILGMLKMEKGQGKYQRGTEILADAIVIRS